MSCSPIYFGRIDLAKSLATAALASRTARPSAPVSDSTELAISAHMRWRLGSLAFLVWRSASSEFHGIGLTSLVTNSPPAIGLLTPLGSSQRSLPEKEPGLGSPSVTTSL